jgi:hypothetical protein
MVKSKDDLDIKLLRAMDWRSAEILVSTQAMGGFF